MSAETKVQTWSAIIIGNGNGLLSHSDDPLSAYPEHYERALLVRKSDFEEAIRERDEAKKFSDRCEEILRYFVDGFEAADCDDDARDEILKVAENLWGMSKECHQLRARVAELEESNRLLREQIRVADVAFNFQMEQKAEMEKDKERLDCVKELRVDEDDGEGPISPEFRVTLWCGAKGISKDGFRQAIDAAMKGQQ